MPKYLGDNDISVTKFLDRSIGKFLSANDITVTKFLEDKDENDISVTKFLQDSENYFPIHPAQRRYYYTPDRPYDLGWDDDLHHTPHYYPGDHYPYHDIEHARTVYPYEYHPPKHDVYERAKTVYPKKHPAPPPSGHSNDHYVNRS